MNLLDALVKTRIHSKRYTIKCTSVYVSVTMQTPVIILHSQQHTGSHTFIYNRSFANKIEHNMNLPGISIASCGGKGRGIWGNFHCSTLVATWDSIFSTTTFALLAQELLFNFPYIHFVTSLAILHQRAIPFIRGPDLWHYDTPSW